MISKIIRLHRLYAALNYEPCLSFRYVPPRGVLHFRGMFRVGTMFQNSLAKLRTLWYDYIKYEINNGGNENAEHNVCPC